MANRRLILSCALITAIALLFYVFYAREPRFNDQPLSHWLSILTSANNPLPMTLMGTPNLSNIGFVPGSSVRVIKQIVISSNGVARTVILPPQASGATPAPGVPSQGNFNQAEEAVRSIGPDAIPFLVDYLSSKDSALKRRILDLLRRQQWLKIPLPRDSEYYRKLGLAGFEALGAQGAAGVPDIAKLLNDPILMDDASKALAAIGPEGVWPFAQAIQHRDAAVRIHATTSLGRYFRNSGPTVVPLLAMAVKDEDIRVRQSAIVSLGQLAQEPATAVPALVHCLKDPQVPVRILALEALANFRNAAQAAIPNVTELLKDPAVEVRQYASITLRKIR